MLKGNKKKTQPEETKQASDPDYARTESMELSKWEFKITMINMLRTLILKKWTTCKNRW